MTYLEPVRLPPLRPWTVGGKIAVSCHRERDFLIRAWCPLSYSAPSRPIEWILHHVGRLNLSDLEWWGYTFRGQPSYMNRNSSWESGLTIQYWVEPSAGFAQRMLDEGRIGPRYGDPIDLEIPERGVVQVRHDV